MCALSMSLEEKAFLFSTWVAPVVYLTARAYNPTQQVLTQLDLVHKVALGLNNWHLTMPILLLPPAAGGLGQASLGAYVQWVHSHTFVMVVATPSRIASAHMGPFQRWANLVGLLLETDFLQYLQLGPVPLPSPTFLQETVKAYSELRKTGGGGVPPPPAHHMGMLGVWHCVLFRNDLRLTYHSPALLRKGVWRMFDLAEGGVIPSLLLGILAPTWQPVYQILCPGDFGGGGGQSSQLTLAPLPSLD